MDDSSRPLSILFLSPFFYPEQISSGRYNTYLVKALIDAGHRVQVVSSHPLYPDWRPKRSTTALEGVETHRGGLLMRYPRQNVPRRMLLELWFTLHALVVGWRKRNETDMVVAVFPPDLFVLLLRAVLPAKVRKIGIIHDVQGIMARSHPGPLRGFAAGVMRAVEKRAFRTCDALICLSESMRQHLIDDYGIDASRCQVYYPFVTLEGGSSGPRSEETSSLFPSEYRHIVYSGALGEKQMPHDLFLFFLKLCEARSDVMCHVFSSGPFFEALRRRAAAVPNDRIRFHGLVPDETLPTIYARSTVQVIPQATGTGAGAFPSKLPNLMAFGVPVFAMCDPESELARVIDETGIGVHVPLTDVDAWPEQVGKLIDDVVGRSHESFRQSAASYVDARFNVDRLVEAILRVDRVEADIV